MSFHHLITKWDCLQKKYYNSSKHFIENGVQDTAKSHKVGNINKISAQTQG